MNYAIVLSGGTGTRLGLDIPKQYYEVNNKPIIGYVIDTLNQSLEVDGIIIVAAAEWQDYLLQQMKGNRKFLGFALPGENRQMSIYNGLCFLKEQMEKTGHENEGDVVLIQDAARPNTSLELIERCLVIPDEVDGAMPVLPMKDTVYLSRTGEKVDELLNRQEIYAGQAPECFRFLDYLKANEALLPDKILQINGSTEPAILAGMNIKMIAGDEKNYKITTETDLKRFCRRVSETM